MKTAWSERSETDANSADEFNKMVGDTGGLAKVACAFANEMYKRGHDVSLVYSDVRKGDFYYP